MLDLVRTLVDGVGSRLEAKIEVRVRCNFRIANIERTFSVCLSGS
jgi:hypothetical protein